MYTVIQSQIVCIFIDVSRCFLSFFVSIFVAFVVIKLNQHNLDDFWNFFVDMLSFSFLQWFNTVDVVTGRASGP